jgi:hypothetical protein
MHKTSVMEVRWMEGCVRKHGVFTGVAVPAAYAAAKALRAFASGS